jgi:MFS family permease
VASIGTGSPGPPTAGGPSAGDTRQLRLYGWRHPAILTAAGLSAASGFAQFGVTTSLADVARAFGQPTEGGSVAARVGLSFTTLGIGLAVIRLSALGSLPLAGLADRLGRRRVLLGCSALGLAISAAAGLSPTYWWFVALFALSRPLLTATNAVSGVIAAEETRSADRAKAIALVTAGYGVGAGLTAIVRGVAGDALSFRGLFALLLIPLAVIPLLARWLEEPERFEQARRAAGRVAGPAGLVRSPADQARSPADQARSPADQARGLAGQARVLARPTAAQRPRLWLLTLLAAGLGFVTGPANSLLFAYSEGVLGLRQSTTALMVAAAGPIGLAGLLAGRWAADRLGRRGTAAITQAVVAVACVITYSGSAPGAIGGYLLAIFASSAVAPALGALASELFPTRVRATVAGWLAVGGTLGAVIGLVVFGLLVTTLDSFWAAAALVAVPVALVSPLFARLPETRGLELEQSAPD